MKKYVIFWILMLTIAAAGAPLYTGAHGAGVSLEEIAGEYIVDIGYDIFEPRAGDAVRFDFTLWNKERTDSPEITGVWFRIAPEVGQGIIFAGQLGVPEFGPPGMSYAFPKAGDYTLTARFMNKDAVLAETLFPFSVREGENAAQARWILYVSLFFMGILTGFFASFLLLKKRAV